MIKMFFTQSLLVIALFSCSILSFGQDTEEDTGKLPVKSTFTAGMLIENPTIMSPYENSFELNIQHRFASMQNGISDIFGIYGAANTRIAMNYGITDKIMVGFGTTMNNKLQDLNWKLALLKQTRSGSVPVSISYYGNAVIDARDKEFFPPKETYRFIHRFSYLTEIIVARKFNDIISMQFAPKFVYFNAVDTLHKNINYGISIGGRAKFWESKTIIFEYDQPLTSGTNSKPNLALGLEIGTATHAFQVFITNYQGIIGQHNLTFNNNDPFGKFENNFMFGFNITVRL
jgi:hypothetical protein